jgi:hypothetical protein
MLKISITYRITGTRNAFLNHIGNTFVFYLFAHSYYNRIFIYTILDGILLYEKHRTHTPDRHLGG